MLKPGTHDNVVTFHDWGVVEGTEYLVFDYLPGRTLRELPTKRAERGKLLPAEDVMRLGRQVARAEVAGPRSVHQAVEQTRRFQIEAIFADGDLAAVVGAAGSVKTPCSMP